MGSTTKELVDELQKIKGAKESRVVQVLIDKARRGHYHDFMSPLETPKIQLVKDLGAMGFADLARRVMNGDFDDEYPSPDHQAEFDRVLKRNGPGY